MLPDDLDGPRRDRARLRDRRTSRPGWPGAAPASSASTTRPSSSRPRPGSSASTASTSRCSSATRSGPLPRRVVRLRDQRVRRGALGRPVRLGPRGRAPAAARRPAPRAHQRPARATSRSPTSRPTARADERLKRPLFGMHRDQLAGRDGAVEFHLAHGDWIRLFRAQRLRDRGAGRARSVPRARRRRYPWMARRVGAPVAVRGDLEGPQARLSRAPAAPRRDVRHGPFGLAERRPGRAPSARDSPDRRAPSPSRRARSSPTHRRRRTPSAASRPPTALSDPPPMPLSCSPSATCASATASSRRSRASRSRSTRARPTACWAPTAPARPPRSPWSAACSRATRAR